MKILLGLIATLSVALVPALAETAKERAHEKVVAEAPPTDSSEQLAAQQIDKSYSSLKAALLLPGTTVKIIKLVGLLCQCTSCLKVFFLC
jgi:hypothetical protein